MDQVIDLASKLAKKFYVIIHFDSKMIIDKKSKYVLKEKKINYFSKVDVHWGWSIGKVTYLLFQEAEKIRKSSMFILFQGKIGR